MAVRYRALLTTVSCLLLALLALSPLAFAEDLATVFDVDETYTRTLPAGEEVAFVWLVYNRQAVDLLVTTAVEPAADAHWAAVPEPRFAIVAPGQGLEVTVRAAADEALDVGTATLTVVFTVASAADPTLRETHTRFAVLVLEPIPPAVLVENRIMGLFENPLPHPFNTRLATFLISVALWGLIAVAVVAVIAPLLRAYEGRTGGQVAQMVRGLLYGPVLALVLAYGAVQSLAILRPPPEVLRLLFLLYSAALILIVTWLAYRIFRGVFIEYGHRLAARRETPLFDRVWPVVNKVGAIVIVLVGASVLAGLFGLDLTAFIAGMGILGIVIALAAQESLSNFFSGVFLLLDRPFKEGDLVEVEGDRCRIEHVGLRTTRVYHRPSHKVLIIPNNKLAREMVVNLVEPDVAIRQETTVGVAYGSDVEKVKAVLVAAASENPAVIADEPEREPAARLEEFGDSGLIFKLKFWVRDADALMRVRGEVNEAINRRLKEAALEIPFPHRVLLIREDLRKMT